MVYVRICLCILFSVWPLHQFHYLFTFAISVKNAGTPSVIVVMRAAANAFCFRIYIFFAFAFLRNRRWAHSNAKRLSPCSVCAVAQFCSTACRYICVYTSIQIQIQTGQFQFQAISCHGNPFIHSSRQVSGRRLSVNQRTV